MCLMKTTEPYPRGTKKVFATLRFSGSELNPGELTDVLGVAPSLAYRKGERYSDSPKRFATGTAPRIGRTGMWFFSTNGDVQEPNITMHLARIAFILAD